MQHRFLLPEMKIKELGTFVFTPEQRQRFAGGGLVTTWKREYALLFDRDDLRLATQQPTHHFFEWLAAILIYSSTGYLSLIEKYHFGNHPHKAKALAKFHDERLGKALALITKRGRRQPPDLLVYSPDFGDWFFCEVKGATDRLSVDQRKLFEEIGFVSKRPVRLLKLVELKPVSKGRSVRSSN
jgi:hypothetical protein